MGLAVVRRVGALIGWLPGSVLAIRTVDELAGHLTEYGFAE